MESKPRGGRGERGVKKISWCQRKNNKKKESECGEQRERIDPPPPSPSPSSLVVVVGSGCEVECKVDGSVGIGICG